MGAWFEAQIVNVSKKVNPDGTLADISDTSATSDAIIYHVKYEEWVLLLNIGILDDSVMLIEGLSVIFI